ncbi:uncharacterized protein V6R79_012404 [Siganus canaliculatus]
MFPFVLHFVTFLCSVPSVQSVIRAPAAPLQPTHSARRANGASLNATQLHPASSTPPSVTQRRSVPPSIINATQRHQRHPASLSATQLHPASLSATQRPDRKLVLLRLRQKNSKQRLETIREVPLLFLNPFDLGQ